MLQRTAGKAHTPTGAAPEKIAGFGPWTARSACEMRHFNQTTMRLDTGVRCAIELGAPVHNDLLN
jgi:hypothetical protein